MQDVLDYFRNKHDGDQSSADDALQSETEAINAPRTDFHTPDMKQDVEDRVAASNIGHQYDALSTPVPHVVPDPSASPADFVPTPPPAVTMTPPASKAGGSGSTDDAAKDNKVGSSSDQIRAMLEEKYGLGKLGTPALMQAMQDSAQGQSSAMKAEAFADMGAALTRGATKVDPAFYNKLADQAKQGPAQIEALRKSQTENMQNDATLDKMADEKDATDPNSRTSRITQGLYQGEAAKYGLNVGDLRLMGAADIRTFLDKPFENASKLQSVLIAKQTAIETAHIYKDIGFTNQAQSALDHDDQFKQAIKNEVGGRNLATQLDLASTDPVAYSMFPLAFVRSLVNRVNPQELKAATGGQDLDSWLQRAIYKPTSGTINPKDLQGFRQIVNAGLQSAGQEKALAIQRHAGQFSAATGMSRDQASYKLSGDNNNSMPGAQTMPLSPGTDQAAIQWAQQNPTDPRAARILSLHGAQ